MIWRSIIIAALCGNILNASEELNRRLERIFDSSSFAERRYGPTRWIRNGEAFTTLEDSAATPGSRDVVEHETATGKRTVLVAAAQLKPSKDARPLRIEHYRWDNDLRRLLIFTESKRVWRTNTRGDFWLYDRTTNALKKLGGPDAPASSLMFAKISPDGSRVAYVRANNIYVEDLASGAVRALTTDGSATTVNGASDWVYEEELNLRDGFRWSPDGRSIAFWQFDTTGVEQFTLINTTDSLYPKLTRIPYPKAGTKNSAVRVGVIDVGKGGVPRWMNIPGDSREHYIFHMEWAGDSSELAIGQLNRKQNTATVYVADARSGVAKPIFRDQDEAWVEVPESSSASRTGSAEWLRKGTSFLWQSERDGWRRAYVVPRNGDITPLTPASTDILSVQAIDPEGSNLYYMAAPDNAIERHLYVTPLAQSAAPRRLTPVYQPGAHSYDIAPNCRWAFHTWSRFDRPSLVELVSLPDHKTVRVLEDNSAVRANVAGLADPPVEFLRLALPNGVTVDGWLIKPRVFDPAKKYPLLVYVYGEPASTTVIDRWGGNRNLFHRALADDGYLVASFDNRGTPAPKGRAWRKSIYGAVGVLSTIDQTEAVLTLARQRPYIDLNRVGVWGWSGGGSNTLNLMFRSPDVFRVGIAVAPVPDQALYDTIYQERYMGLPSENAAGYRKGSPIYFAEGLRGRLLIVHGSGDDNVHYQGTEKLINRLVELGRPFDMMAYPNRSHSISEGKGTTLHVYSLIARYLEENLPAGPK